MTLSSDGIFFHSVEKPRRAKPSNKILLDPQQDEVTLLLFHHTVRNRDRVRYCATAKVRCNRRSFFKSLLQQIVSSTKAPSRRISRVVFFCLRAKYRHRSRIHKTDGLRFAIQFSDFSNVDSRQRCQRSLRRIPNVGFVAQIKVQQASAKNRSESLRFLYANLPSSYPNFTSQLLGFTSAKFGTCLT